LTINTLSKQIHWFVLVPAGDKVQTLGISNWWPRFQTAKRYYCQVC